MDERSFPIITIEEAAELLQIPVSSVYKLAREGKIPAQKVGKHWRFHRATLLTWVSGPANFEGKKPGRGGADFS